MLFVDPLRCREQLVDRAFAEHEDARGVVIAFVHGGERVDDPAADPLREGNAYGGDVPAGDGIHLAGIDQPADLLGNDLGWAAGVDVDEFDLAAGDPLAGVELLDRELAAGQAGGAVDPGRPLLGHDEGDRDHL